MEIWKTIIGNEDYQVSSLGNVKSLKFSKEKILKAGVNSYGYLHVNLSKKGIRKVRNIHQLVAIAFLNHTQCEYDLIVNHIDFNKTNNTINNLEIVTVRENTNRRHIKSSSEYVGVCWDKQMNKWRASIKINGKLKYLGLFLTELEAHNAYQNKLLSLNL